MSKSVWGGALLLTLSLSSAPAQADTDRATRKAIDAAIAGEHRSDENRARDAARQPKKTLEYFGLRKDMTVVEVWPGGGWYTEILAPVLRDEGKLYLAQFSPNTPYSWARAGLGRFFSKLGAHRDIYSKAEVTFIDPPFDLDIAPRGSADMVLSFRNVHNWTMDMFGGGRYFDHYFDAMYAALKPGGILGIVDHRWPDPANEDPKAGNGYISVERTVKVAEAAGFKLVGESKHLRNDKDTHDHPRGVWTLPPSYALGDQDRAKYEAIGESDRFVLKFVKPKE